MVLTLMGCGGSNGDDITTYTYSSELDIKNLDSSDAFTQGNSCSNRWTYKNR